MVSSQPLHNSILVLYGWKLQIVNKNCGYMKEKRIGAADDSTEVSLQPFQQLLETRGFFQDIGSQIIDKGGS